MRELAHHAYTSRNLNPDYRGRVRSGCLTCRASKVKCDEQRPCCRRCDRLQRKCTYKFNSPPNLFVNAPERSENASTREYSHAESRTGGVSALNAEHESTQSPSSALAIFHWLDSPLISTSTSPASNSTSRQTPDLSILQSPSAVSWMTSQDIFLCTAIDRLEIDEAQILSSISSFSKEIDTNLVSIFDPVNWIRFKSYAVKLSSQSQEMTSCIFIVQSTTNALNHGIPAPRSIQQIYEHAKHSLESMAQRDNDDVDSLLATILLLCIYEMLSLDDIGSCLGHVEPDSALFKRLQVWTAGAQQSPLSVRIAAWLRILHASARRGGNPGLLSKHFLALVSTVVPTRSLVQESSGDVDEIMYDSLSTPIFELYLRLQELSAQVADLSHYHRSRITIDDQMEVAELMASIKWILLEIWDKRPALMRLLPSDVRAQLMPQVAEPLVNLIQLCTAIYYAEIVEIGRTLSDPPLASDEAKDFMRRIRKVVESHWATSNSDERFKAGFLRPLFLCAIESMNSQDIHWAVTHLQQIKDPASRSDFFASFAESLAAAQLTKGRRVTTKFFCQLKYHIDPPCL